MKGNEEELYHMYFDPRVLRAFLQREQIATLQELKQALQTTSTMTVFRKLKTLAIAPVIPIGQILHSGRYPSI